MECRGAGTAISISAEVVGDLAGRAGAKNLFQPVLSRSGVEKHMAEHKMFNSITVRCVTDTLEFDNVLCNQTASTEK